MPVKVEGRKIYINTQTNQTVKICDFRNQRSFYEKYYRIFPPYVKNQSELAMTVSKFGTLSELENWLKNDRNAKREPQNEAGEQESRNSSSSGNQIEFAEESTNKRGLSEELMSSLKEGTLKPILERVILDSVMDLQIRENYINIYYRGGNILKITEKNREFIPHFDINYVTENTINFTGLPYTLETNKDVEAWLNSIPYLKHEMDIWFGGHPKNEREFQQLVSRENNYSKIANSTDYFIIDIEYDNRKGDSSKKGARFDLVAVKWESDGVKRKLPKSYKPTLSFIEMKYSDGALKGKAGIGGHIKDFKTFSDVDMNITQIKSEMAEVFQQKRELGLVTGLKGNNNRLEKFAEKIEYVFLLANHDPEKSTLKSLLEEVLQKENQNEYGFDIKFCTSNFMGYGLYKENFFNTKTFYENFKKQIFNQ